MESVIKTLNDLGVVVYEWNDNGRSYPANSSPHAPLIFLMVALRCSYL